MRCPQCFRNFRDRKALLCHMNHPFGSCNSHFEEVVNLVDELQRYQERRRQHRPIPTQARVSTTPEPMDIDIDVTATEDLREDIQNVDGSPFIQEYVGAAREYGRGTTFLQSFDRDQYAQERKKNIFYPFASRAEWEMAAFLLRSGLSMASIDSFLSLELINGLGLSFRNARRLRGLAEMLPQGPEWRCKPCDSPFPMKKNVDLFYRDPLECIQSILSNPLMSDHIRFTPFRVYESAVSAMRIYTEWLSGDAAWSMQSQLPDGATLLGVVLSSDKTNISAMTGGRVAHPLLISLANLLMDFRMKGTNHAFLLLALLPIPNFIHKDSKTRGILENRMVHECLDFILTPLKKAAQFGIMMSDPLGYKQFGDPFRHEPRTASTTLAQLHAIEARVNPWHLNAYIKETMKVRLNGVHRPFWRDWALSEPSKFFTPEPLHHWHKMFWDHDAKWCIRALKGAEIDYRFSILHPHTGFRQFREGVSKLKQVTGREHRDIQRYIVAIIADAVPNDFLVAIRSLMDFRYLAQAPEISEQDCVNIDRALQGFHDHKSSIVSAGVRIGKRKKVLKEWYIPKLELMQSVSSSIRENGAAIQWTADTTERCHITEIKVPSRSSNKQGYESQICRYLDREEKCRQFDLATSIREAKVDFHSPDNVDCEYPDDGDGNVDGLSENPEGPEELIHGINTTGDLLTHIRPVAPVSGTTIRRHANYFELASCLKQGLYPRALLPFRTVVNGNTALHLSRDPTMKAMSVEDAMAKFNLPDLRGALADFLVRFDAGDPIQIGGRRVANRNSSLPFQSIQVWTKLQLQGRSYYAPNRVLSPQTVNASPPSESWPCGRSDVVLFNIDQNKVWPYSGLEGHRVAQIRLIFRAVPSQAFSPSSNADLFLSYVQRFDIVPQPNPVAPASSNQKGSYPHPITGMYLLKRARRIDGAIMGDVVPLAQLRTLVDLVPRLGAEADKRLTTETALEYSLEFWLNRYFDKELFYALK
ncbi:hypothetical protein EDB85DRAFT_1868605 [Lactarius pseudohatsudake]|nr:hypothetical protein EDB85DRAFT_1875816 [Lactarius pseudohatsudake]KAH9015465.1 hypothetical protein EDB85DRAFT_1875810 [Lactarius pseudohatsudake]KAH9027020.1 hypothetical protein EDB85DRAFT_1868605 [Lactarius pseudohatsudake]